MISGQVLSINKDFSATDSAGQGTQLRPGVGPAKCLKPEQGSQLVHSFG